MARYKAAVLIGIAVVVLPALAQEKASPVGTWRSAAIQNKDWPIAAAVQLTIKEVAPDQTAKGTFRVFMAGYSGGGAYGCPTGPVTGTFDGVALKVAAQASNLCYERVFDVKLEGDKLVGMYKGASGDPMPMTFTREK